MTVAENGTLEITLEGLIDARGRHTGVFLLLRDVTVEQLQRAGMASAQDALRGELQRTQAKLSLLENDVNRDSLTHLFNRRFFETQAPRLLDHARRDSRPVTLALFDIDCFKQYNDTYGHMGGDNVLRKVAAELAAAVRRPGDLAARYGGEEFVIILQATTLKTAQEVAERIRQTVEMHPFVFESKKIKVKKKQRNRILLANWTYPGIIPIIKLFVERKMWKPRKIYNIVRPYLKGLN